MASWSDAPFAIGRDTGLRPTAQEIAFENPVPIHPLPKCSKSAARCDRAGRRSGDEVVIYLWMKDTVTNALPLNINSTGLLYLDRGHGHTQYVENRWAERRVRANRAVPHITLTERKLMTPGLMS